VLTNFYSAPLPVGVQVQAKVYPANVEIWHQGKCVARHERSFGRFQKVLDLEHYLDALIKKPGALAGSTPLEQWRARGLWPESFDEFWKILKERRGKQDGTRAMVELIMLGRKHGYRELEEAVETWLFRCGRGALADRCPESRCAKVRGTRGNRCTQWL
jgi:hypothetical protein